MKFPDQFRRCVVACLAALLAVPAIAATAEAGSALALAAKYAELRGQLRDNQFQKPLVLVSSESQDRVEGDIYALIDQPYGTAAGALSGPTAWCEILFLHLNTKYCRAETSAHGDIVNVSIGKKYDQPVEQAYQVTLAHRVAVRTSDYLQVRLSAEKGPLSTRDYSIVLEAIPIEGKTFLHLSYSYGFGAAGRMAMKLYLGTVGSSKVGFTVTGTRPDGQRQHIGGMRGLVERNTMRYYLAIEAHLNALTSPPQVRIEQSLRAWFAATERYALQLHELGQDEYLDMKRKEYQRQQTDMRRSTRPAIVA